MKNITTIAILLTIFTTSNSQMISRSSISSISKVSSNNGLTAQSIGRMYFPSTMVDAPIVNVDSTQTATAIDELSASTIEFGALAAYPNPAVDNIHVAFELPENGNVNMAIYNAMGQKISDVYNNNYSGGKGTHQIDLTSYANGVYFITLNFTSSNDNQLHIITKKFQIVK